ncbi:MAG: hypothetical protein ACRDL1_05890 [Solirubrobacterales bacterium]
MSLPIRRDGEGFRDSLSFDFADPESGASGLVLVGLRAAASRAVALGLVLDRDAEIELSRSEVELDPPGDWGDVELDGARVADDGARATVAFEAEGGSLEIEVTRLSGAAFEAGSAFSEGSGLAHEVFSARVDGAWRSGGSTTRIEALGRVTRTAGELDWTRIELIRSLAAVLDDGSLLAVASARPRGAAGHGEEATSAVLLDADGVVSQFAEPLLSTEYDASGRHRRAGVELWGPDDAAALRGAGTRLGGAAVELGGTSLETAFLSFTLDGAPGTAKYDLVRGT